MLMAYLLSGLVVAVITTFLFLMAGGSLMMAFFVYTISGFLMTASLAAAAIYRCSKN
jgi:hypothetical protein